MNKMIRHDTGREILNVYKTDQGYLRGICRVTRTGIFLYKNPDGTIRRELRHPDEVFAKDTMDSLKMIPITNLHPTSNEGLVSADTAKALSIGMTGEEVFADGKFVVVPIAITTKDGVDAVETGREELSLGYTFERDETPGEYDGQRYDLAQRSIRYNHLAIVERGRAGVEVRLLRADSGVELTEEESNEHLLLVDQVCDGCGSIFKKRKDDKTTTCEGCGKKLKKQTDGIEPNLGSTMVKINLDGKDFDVDEGLKQTIDVLLASVKSKTAALDATSAERDSLTEQLKVEREKHGDQAINAMIKERVALEKVAHDFLDEPMAAKIGDLSNLDLKKVIVLSVHKDAKLDGRSNEYIDARYDSVVELGKPGSTIESQRKTVNGDQGSKIATDTADNASKAMRERLLNAYKR
jgi:hypothetical protein